jgi:hypothetical protein
VLRRHAGEDPDHVLVLRTLGAPQRRFLRGRRAKRIEPVPDPEPVVTARATLIDAQPLADAAAAESWLRRTDGEALVAEALRTLNRVLHLHRVAAADYSVRDVTREQAIVARVGYGLGEEVADGRYSAAVELPASRGEHKRRTAALRPQERLAALLSGRDAALACEALVLQARAEIDAGRGREAALLLPSALEAALVELEPWAERGDLRARLAELAELAPEAERGGRRALEGGLDEVETKAVDRVLGGVAGADRRRRRVS